MTHDEFKSFAEQTIVDILAEAEHESGRSFTANPVLRWYPKPELVRGDLAEALTARVFVDSEHIYPMVDIGVCDITPEGEPVIFALVAGYPPLPFRPNWSGRDGPFIHVVGAGLATGTLSASSGGALAYRVIKPTPSTTNGA